MKKRSKQKERSKGAIRKWNLPDWRDETLYPIPRPEKDDSDLSLWRWEFLRRDVEYREDWEHFRALKHPFQLALEDDPVGPGRNEAIYPIEYEERHGHIYYCLWKYKLARLLNPTIANPRQLEFYPVPSDGLLLWFDLALPLARQLKRARAILDLYSGETDTRDTRPVKAGWPLLLRVLDAFEEGISLPKIGKELLGFPDKDDASANAAKRLELAERFWKKLPIHREFYQVEGKLLRPEDVEPLFPPYIPRSAGAIDQLHPPKMPRIAVPL